MNLTPTECPAEGKCLERTLFISPQHVIRCDGSENKMLREEKYLRLFSAFILFLSQMSHWILRNCVKYMFVQMLFEKRWFKNRRVSLRCLSVRHSEAMWGEAGEMQTQLCSCPMYSDLLMGRPWYIGSRLAALSVCVISVSFGLYARIRECVCIHVWWCECVCHTAVHWPRWPLLERFCMAAIFDPMPSQGSL